ncbi:spermatogenesis-associated protein 32 [Pteronotus mesoamericanus]|uniref:spermatogenesis-associated protein 32 n=1 Tax=Pteronotus mesoamericanus TaxID=1884717 RepID=UPI0023ED1E29|nr:spermatogenesis-associated protein 32 [Pteronotus parnellii mesoamericanus]
MGVTGANGFPCCTKDSVDIIDTQIDIGRHQLQLTQKEDETELEDESVELESPHDVNLELETAAEDKAVPPLEWCLAPTLKSEATLVSNPEACSAGADPEEQTYRIEPVHPYTDEPVPRDACQWSIRSNSSYPSHMEEEQASATHHSIRVQTSKHLFWADKHIQASEQGLQWEASRQPGQESTAQPASCPNQKSVPKDTLGSEKPLRNPSPQPELSDTGSGQPPDTHPPSSELATAISLEDLVNFATSLAIASSSKAGLPSLGQMMKAPHAKAAEPAPAPMMENATRPAKEEPEQERLSKLLEKPPEKLLEAGEPKKACKQKDQKFLPPYLDCSRLAPYRAIIEGKVKFLQTPAMSSPPAEDRKENRSSYPSPSSALALGTSLSPDPPIGAQVTLSLLHCSSVPGTKKGSPLLLKIHFKLSPPSPPEK